MRWNVQTPKPELLHDLQRLNIDLRLYKVLQTTDVRDNMNKYNYSSQWFSILSGVFKVRLYFW